MPDESSQSGGCGPVGGGTVGLLGGFVVLLFASSSAIAAIYGVNRHDSSAVWGLAGLRDFLFTVSFSPLYLITFLISYAFLLKRSRSIKKRRKERKGSHKRKGSVLNGVKIREIWGRTSQRRQGMKEAR